MILSRITKKNIIWRLIFVVVLAVDVLPAKSVKKLWIGESYIFSYKEPENSWWTGIAFECDKPNYVSLEDVGYYLTGSHTGRFKATILRYFSGTATIRVRLAYSWYDKKSGHYLVGWYDVTEEITCYPPTISLSPTYKNLQPGDKFTITASIGGTNSSSLPLVTWTTSNNNVASFDYIDGNYNESDGYRRITVVAKNPGQATIKALIGDGISATCAVTVKNLSPENIALPNEKTIKLGQTITLTPTFSPNGAGSNLTWKSSDPNIASVNSSGQVTGKAEGEAVITATTTNGLSATCRIEVYKPVPTSIQLSEKNLTIPIEGTQKLTYTVSPSDAIYTVDWQSDSPDIASVDKSGLVTAHSEGMACITVMTDNGVSDRCIINVPPLPKRVYLPDSLFISLRKSFQLEYRQRPEDALSSYYRWQTSDQDVVTVTDEGLVKAVGVGEAEVSLQTGNGLEAVCVVVVIEPLYNLVVWTKDSVRTDFSFVDKPQITMSGDVFTVTSQKISVEYNALDIDKFTLELMNETSDQLVDAVASVQAEKPIIRVTPDMLTVSGCKPQSDIAVYSLDARLVARARTDANGQAQISLASLSRGVYIVKTETTTYKITKK